MNSQFLLLSGLISLVGANDVIFTREYVWRNYKDFIDYGWVENFPNTTRTYSTPSELDLKLYELNGNFTDEVWGGTQRHSGQPGNRFRYHVDIATKPEFCGMINATASIKFYLEGSGSYNDLKSAIYPACTTNSNQQYRCNLKDSTFGNWSTKTVELHMPTLRSYKSLVIVVFLATNGIYLLDEVQLNYTVQQGLHNCPNSCNHECEYRGIDCHNYYTCIDRRYKEFRTCDKDKGLAFNPATKSCDLIENVEGCHDQKPTPPPHCICEYRPHETNCSKYYYCPDICHLEECEERSCPGGLLWNVDAKGDGSGQQQCAPANETSCWSDTVPTTDSSQTIETTLVQETGNMLQ